MATGWRQESRPVLRIETLLLIVTGWLLLVMNGAWWRATMSDRSASDLGSWLFLACMAVTLLALHFALLAPFANRWTVRPLLTVLVIGSAAAAYFMRRYGVVMDPSMMRNVLATDAREAAELVTWSFAGRVALGSAPAIALVWWVRLERHPWPRALGRRVAAIAGALLVAVLAILPVNRDFTSLMRNHRELRYLITPGNLVYGFVSNGSSVRESAAPREPVGRDARLSPLALAPHRPRVFVLVVGETARAANFSLLGYERPTTPELARLDVVAFGNVTACGTSTEVSLPCLFSRWGRADYDERRIRRSEGLLDVLARAGYAVKWFDNQSGCKGVCRGVEYEKVSTAVAPEFCARDECQDGILVRRLQAELASLRAAKDSRDTVIVLHMMGNHGPAYFRRYPPGFRRFMPDCATAELRDCTRQQVVNAYDNAILYTDHVLAELVRTLAAEAERLDTALLYVSDHGESLGEAGLYLHGMPYAIAPRTQTRVPMLAWMSPGFARSDGVNVPCLRKHSNDALSHDNVFHSVLGLLDVQTAAYRAERDLFAGCRQATQCRLAGVAR